MHDVAGSAPCSRRREETGVLVARHERREKQFYFVAGELRAARSTEHSELLRTRLLHAGGITELICLTRFRPAKRTGGSLGEEPRGPRIVRRRCYCAS